MWNLPTEVERRIGKGGKNISHFQLHKHLYNEIQHSSGTHLLKLKGEWEVAGREETLVISSSTSTFKMRYNIHVELTSWSWEWNGKGEKKHQLFPVTQTLVQWDATFMCSSPPEVERRMGRGKETLFICSYTSTCTMRYNIRLLLTSWREWEDGEETSVIFSSTSTCTMRHNIHVQLTSWS